MASALMGAAGELPAAARAGGVSLGSALVLYLKRFSQHQGNTWSGDTAVF